MIAYHNVREPVVSEAIQIAHEPGKFNLADCYTKLMETTRLKTVHTLYPHAIMKDYKVNSYYSQVHK
jgi:hypothetical protein